MSGRAQRQVPQARANNNRRARRPATTPVQLLETISVPSGTTEVQRVRLRDLPQASIAFAMYKAIVFRSAVVLRWIPLGPTTQEGTAGVAVSFEDVPRSTDQFAAQGIYTSAARAATYTMPLNQFAPDGYPIEHALALEYYSLGPGSITVQYTAIGVEPVPHAVSNPNLALTVIGWNSSQHSAVGHHVLTTTSGANHHRVQLPAGSQIVSSDYSVLDRWQAILGSNTAKRLALGALRITLDTIGELPYIVGQPWLAYIYSAIRSNVGIRTIPQCYGMLALLPQVGGDQAEALQRVDAHIVRRDKHNNWHEQASPQSIQPPSEHKAA